MTKAGIWKKIKTFAKSTGQKLGKAASWLNENVLKPAGGLVKPVIDIFDPTGIGSKVYDGVTKVIDYANEYNGYVPDNSFANTTEFISEALLDTQQSKKDRKYKDPFDTAIKFHNEISNSRRDYNSYRRVKDEAKRMKDMRNNFQQALERHGSGKRNYYGDYSDDDYSDEYDYEYA